MKLQLNESTLNAYINEAIRQELNEGGKSTVLKKTVTPLWNALKKRIFGAGDDVARAVTRRGGKALEKTPLKFRQNFKFGKSAWNTVRDFEKGRPVKMSYLSGKNAGKEFFVKQEKGVTKYYEAVKNKSGKTVLGKEITDKNALKSAKNLWKNEYRVQQNLANSFKRNFAGTAAAATAGIALANGGGDGNTAVDPDAPWNTPENGGNNGGGDNGGGFDGSFPWDSTNPVYTPRPPRKKKKAATPDPVAATPGSAATEETGSTTPRISGRIEAPTTSIAATLPKQQDTIQGGIRPLDQTLTQRALSTMAKAGTDAVENGNKRVKGLGGIERGARRAGGDKDKDTLRKARKSVQQGVKDAANQNL